MGAVIGFDARFNSRRWATLAAGIFLRMGFKNVRLFSQITPTPFVPFTVVQNEASIGIMVTASHNPKEDNGYKVFWRNGAQVKFSSFFGGKCVPLKIENKMIINEHTFFYLDTLST